MSKKEERDDAIQKRLADVPDSCKNTYKRAAAGTASPRAAIKAFCLECTGWDRRQVVACTSLSCPLYSYRPFQYSKIAQEIKNEIL